MSYLFCKLIQKNFIQSHRIAVTNFIQMHRKIGFHWCGVLPFCFSLIYKAHLFTKEMTTGSFIIFWYIFSVFGTENRLGHKKN